VVVRAVVVGPVVVPAVVVARVCVGVEVDTDAVVPADVVW
jgi:hypothetical protein